MTHPTHSAALSTLRWGLLAVLVLGAAACSGPREAGPDAIEGERPDPAPRTVQGFQIQVLTTGSRDEADAAVEHVLAWWDEVPPAERPPALQRDDVPVDIAWQQPYYRVRLGRFAERGAAEAALALVRRRFDEAFVVPAEVTITR